MVLTASDATKFMRDTMNNVIVRHTIALLFVFPLTMTGCSSRKPAHDPSVGSAWRNSAFSTADRPPRTGPDDQPPASAPVPPKVNSAPSTSDAIGSINQIEVPRQRVLDLLMKSRGPLVFEQVAMLAVVERLAADRGLSVSRFDIDREYEITLRALTDPLAAVNTDSFDRKKAGELLDAILSRRDVSREEFMIGVRRNAYLRRITESEIEVSEDQLRAAFLHRHGPRVQVRHIQLATPGEVARIKQALAGGADFSALARQHSANQGSAARGGLLEPFSLDDPEVPAAIRSVTARLGDSSPSDAVRVGQWYHVLRLEHMLPADSVRLEDVRSELGDDVRRRLADPEMRKLYQTLFENADITIVDPVLRDAFDATFKDRPAKSSGK